MATGSTIAASRLGLPLRSVDASGRAKGLASHGLRKRMAERLAHLGCGDEWIAAVLGHKDTRQVKVYTKGANRATHGALGPR